LSPFVHDTDKITQRRLSIPVINSDQCRKHLNEDHCNIITIQQALSRVIMNNLLYQSHNLVTKPVCKALSARRIWCCLA